MVSTDGALGRTPPFRYFSSRNPCRSNGKGRCLNGRPVGRCPQSLAHIALVVRDYDEAIAWFTGKLGFNLVADEYQPEQDKRWVLVAPPGAGPDASTLLLARASTPEQEAFIGNQAGGR